MKINHFISPESLDSIENDEPLKNCDFLFFGGLRGPQKTPKSLNKGVLGAP